MWQSWGWIMHRNGRFGRWMICIRTCRRCHLPIWKVVWLWKMRRFRRRRGVRERRWASLLYIYFSIFCSCDLFVTFPLFFFFRKGRNLCFSLPNLSRGHPARYPYVYIILKQKCLVYKSPSQTAFCRWIEEKTLVHLSSQLAYPNPDFSHIQFIYRLSACSHLSLGLFSTFSPPYPSLSTIPPARPPFSSQPQQKSVLIAHVVATMTDTPHVTDRAMDYPPDWKSSDTRDDPRGHRGQGRTLAVHSVAVLPEYQKMKLGITVMKAYLQRMSSARVADRVSLLAHREFVGFYEKLGFEEEGVSSSELYGGGWVNMVCNLSSFKFISSDWEPWSSSYSPNACWVCFYQVTEYLAFAFSSIKVH